MSRGINFSAGPSALPEKVLEEARDAIWNWNGLGTSVLEMSHRSEPIENMVAEAEQDLRDLLSLSKAYHILFLGGSARTQFAMIPMNFLRDEKKVDYLLTGAWSEMAYREAKKYGEPHVVASNHAQGGYTLPDVNTWQMNPQAAYFYYVSNETLTGVAFHEVPNTLSSVPLVADMTSDFLSKSIDVNRFGLIFAGCQKNVAPAGMTIVIVHENYLSQAMLSTPSVYHYALQAEQHSLYNTPPVFQIFMAGRMFKWLKAQGGLTQMEERNRQKAIILYNYIDNSSFYHNAVSQHCRSHMNVSFSLREPRLESLFLQQAENHGLFALKGHTLVGGFRASLYNAITLENVKTLIDFMADFEKKEG